MAIDKHWLLRGGKWVCWGLFLVILGSSNIKNIWISWLCFEGRQICLLRTLFSVFCYSFEKSTSFVGQFPLLNFLDWRVEICWILLFGLINIPIPGIIFLGLFWIISNLSGETLKSVKYSGQLHFMYSDTRDSRALTQTSYWEMGQVV